MMALPPRRRPVLPLLLACSSACAQPPPTVILTVVVDDLGFANVGWHSPNAPENLTPRLSALAAEGVTLDRHYNHFTCTPSRSAFMSGRLPVHVQTTLANPDVQTAGLPVNITTLPQKLRLANFSSHIAGKWDLGFATPHHTPEGRGYRSSLIYAEHMNNYFSYLVEPTGTSCPANQSIYDLWDSGAPAASLVGKGAYIEDLFLDRMLAKIAAFDPNSGGRLHLDYRPHSMHWPLMLPKAAFDAFAWVEDDEPACSARFYGDAMWPGGGDNATAFSCRRQYQAMLSLMDAKVGQVVDALVSKDLWNSTLMTFFSDNGGCNELTENAGNNFPLRGGKYNENEGGVRVVAFLSGGYLPASARGTVSHALVTVADHYLTLCVRAGLTAAACRADEQAAAGGLPPVDSLDYWPVVVDGAAGPLRTELPISPSVLLQTQADGSGPWFKLMRGPITGAGWTSAHFPNATGDNPMGVTLHCGANAGGACLFDVLADPGEHEDISAANADVVTTMTARLAELAAGFYSNSDVGVDVCPAGTPGDCACWAAAHVWGGFLGPWQK